MHKIALADPHDLVSFRNAARGLITAGVEPGKTLWVEGDSEGLFDTPYLPTGEALSVPSVFVELARDVICHRDPERLALLYQALWRLRHGEKALLADAADPLVHRLRLMQKAVTREIHKAHAFVRFRRVDTEEGERYVAWFEPEHYILGRIAPFFTGRFPSMSWSILTPLGSIMWD